jgi:uncharacterized protein involved in outer membrane biogenesis
MYDDARRPNAREAGMKWLEYVRSKPMLRKGLIAGVGAVLVYTLFGFLALPPILKSVISKTLSETLHRKAELRDIRINPLKLSISVRWLTISERDAPGPWISAEEVFANLQLASVIRGGPVLSEIRLSRPYVNIMRRPDGSYNFTDLIDEFTKKPKKESKPLKYSFNNIQVVDGSIDFDDGPKKTRHEVRGIQVAIPFLSNIRYYVNRYVQPSFSAAVNGKAVGLKGKTKPFSESLETTIDVNISDLDIPHYLEYVPLQREYEIPSAFLDVKAVVSFTQHKDKPPTLRAEGDVTLKAVRLSGKDKSPMIRLPMVKAVISPSDLAARDFRLAALQLKDPEIDVSIDRNGMLNLLSLIPKIQKEKEVEKEGEKTTAKEEPGGKEQKFTVDSIRLSGGKVRFADASLGSPFKTALGDIRIDVNGLGTGQGKKADAFVSFSTEAGEAFELKGNLTLSPLALEGTVALAKVVLKKYAPYFIDAVRFDIHSGTLDARSGYRFAQGDGGPEFQLSGLGASVSDLRLRQREEKGEFLVIPEFAVKEAEVDPGRKQITIGGVATSKGSVAVRRSAGGETNVARLVPDDAQSAELTGAKGARTKSGAKKPAEKPWGVTIKETVVDRYSVRFEDRTTDPPVEIALDRIRLKAENIATGAKQRGTFSFATLYNRRGNISLGGTFAVDPPSMSARLKAKTLPIGPFEPYYTGRVKILLTGGAISGEGNVSFDAPKNKPLRAGFRGEVSVNDFSSLDKALEGEFLKFTSLRFGGVEVGYNPTSISIREISLTDFYSRIIVNPDGTLNVQGIVAKEGTDQDNAALKPAPADNAAQKPGVPVRIDTVTLQGGAVNFSDMYVKPNYSASLVEIGGRVTGLSSEESRLADIDLRGKLENSALLGAIFGGGEQLSYLEFAPGIVDVPAGEEGKLGNLAKALHDRPALKIEIEGHVDIEKDREAMRQLIFRRKVAARKLADLAKTGLPAPALDNVHVETAEYPKYLVRAYKAEKFPKPRNFIGMAKDLPVPEMEKLMLTHIQVTDDDLRHLAVERASHVRGRLVASGKVDPERVFLVAPKTLPPERKEKLKDSRVDFRLR